MKRVLAMLTSRPMYGKERSNIEVYGILAQRKDVRLSVVINKEADEKLKKEVACYDTHAIVCPERTVQRFRLLKFAWGYVVGNLMLLAVLLRKRPQLLMMCGEKDFYDFYPALLLYRGPIIYRIGDAPAFEGLSFRKYNGHIWRQYVLPRVSTFVCISKYIRHTVEQAGRNTAGDVIIYNYPPTRKFFYAGEESLYGSRNGMLRYGFIGQVFDQKGVHHLIEATLRILEQQPQVMLYIAGSLTYVPEYVEQVQAIVPERWKKQIVFLGEITNLDTFFAHVDVLCVPSIKQEPLGNVIVEAKKYARPCIVYPNGGMPELISEGIDGFVCDKPDAESLYQKMVRYVQVPGLAQQQGKASLQSVDKLGIDRKHFEEKWNGVFDRYI